MSACILVLIIGQAHKLLHASEPHFWTAHAACIPMLPNAELVMTGLLDCNRFGPPCLPTSCKICTPSTHLSGFLCQPALRCNGIDFGCHVRSLLNHRCCLLGESSAIPSSVPSAIIWTLMAGSSGEVLLRICIRLYNEYQRLGSFCIFVFRVVHTGLSLHVMVCLIK